MPTSPRSAGCSRSTSGIWRNDNAPLADTLLGWVQLPGTDVGAGIGYQRRISALGISRANSPNVLYYGTTDGIVVRAANANTGAPSVSFVSPPGLNAGTAQGGFVRCIAVDPTNSNRALVAYGNYNFPGLWYTTDGGANWTDVEGNLAGASGPSIRWATMFYLDGQLMVYLGTSIGLLSTAALTGGSTSWIQEAAADIGNVPVAYMDYRDSDHTLAVATHGRGVFTTRFVPVGAVGVTPTSLRLGPSYPNPTRGPASITFDLPRPADVSLRLYDVSGREVAVLADGPWDAGRHVVPVATQKTLPCSSICLYASCPSEPRFCSRCFWSAPMRRPRPKCVVCCCGSTSRRSRSSPTRRRLVATTRPPQGGGAGCRRRIP